MTNRTALARLFILITVLGAPLYVLAQSRRTDIDKAVDSNIGDHIKFQQFMTQLQQAVAKHDAAAVAALVSYPLTINPRSSKAMRIRTPHTFIASYDKIVTPAIADVIEKQKYEDLFVNYKGAMFGLGEVWIIGICHDKTCKQTEIKIKTIQSTRGDK